jgi:hypothetical protein
MRNSDLVCRCKNMAAFGFGFIFLVLFLSACKSGQTISKPVVPVATEDLNYLGSVTNNTPVITNLSSKMKLTVNSNGKDISVNGTLRMKKDEVIQLSITPFLGIEAGRVEFTPTKVLIIDRINKQYVEEPISELSAMANTDMDFYTLQALFTNALFLPGNKELNNKLLSQFTVHSSVDNKTMEIKKKSKEFLYSFSATPNTGQLVESSISTLSAPYQLNWKYADFQPFGSKNFPSRMDISFEGGKKPFSAEIDLSKLTENGDWESPTSVSAKYKKMDFNELLKVLLGL